MNDPAGDMPQPVAQGLGLGDLEVAVQQQGLRPARQGLGGQHQLSQAWLRRQQLKRQVPKSGGLAAAATVLHVGAVKPILWRAPGVGPLAAADRADALGPAGTGKVQARWLSDQGAQASARGGRGQA